MDRIKKRNLVIEIVLGLIALYFASFNFPPVMASYGRGIGFTINSLTLALVTVIGFYAIDRIFKVNFRLRHYMMVSIIAMTCFLSLYFSMVYYDKLLHFFVPVLVSSMIFYMMKDLKIDTKWKLAFTFFTVSALVGIWEIGEFPLDLIWNLRLQGVFVLESGKFVTKMLPLDDTIYDMLFGSLGSLAYCLVMYVYLKKKKMCFCVK